MATLDDMSRDSEQMAHSPRLPRGLSIGIRTALDDLSRESVQKAYSHPLGNGLVGPRLLFDRSLHYGGAK